MHGASDQVCFLNSVLLVIIYSVPLLIIVFILFKNEKDSSSDSGDESNSPKPAAAVSGKRTSQCESSDSKQAAELRSASQERIRAKLLADRKSTRLNSSHRL